jgi:hypothetical protein
MVCAVAEAVSPGSKQVATPEEDGVTAEHPGIATVLSVKATVPVRAVLPDGAVTVAVKLTAGETFTVEGFSDEVNARVVAPVSTTCATVSLFPEKFVSLA